jgi:hypothetical protein
MRKTVLLIAAALVAAGLAGCGKSPDTGAKQTRLKLEADSHNGMHPSGRPEAPFIDPSRKTVVVLAAPSAPQLVAREAARITGERDKVESQIHGLMSDYTANLHSTANKTKYAEQISQQLETYKRQTLQLYLLQRQADHNGSAGQ